MRPRTFILLILVLLVGGVAAVLIIANSSGGGLFRPSANDNRASGEAEELSTQEPGVPPPEPTAAVRFETVVIAKVDLPVGQRLTSELLEVEQRPNTNIALQGGYTFSEIEELVGKLLKVNVSEGQAILSPMIALSPTELVSFGSDLALYVDRGKVAIAFPISKLSGAAFAMRPGDFVDVLMTLRFIKIDPEFRTALRNLTYRVDETALLEGNTFLFPANVQGRLEFIPEISQVVEIIPGDFNGGEGFESGEQIPKRVTQLTIQQAEVLWVGTWRPQDELRVELEPTPIPVVAGEEGGGEDGNQAGGQVAENFCLSPLSNQLVPCPIVRESNEPDVVILSMSAQDALALKWALERDVDIDLALRAQGDKAIFTTAGVSLPQIVNEGVVIVPGDSDVDLYPRVDEVERPSLPPEAPTD